MGIHRYSANQTLDATYGSGAPASLYLALMSESPSFTATGATLVEPTAADYARIEIVNNATNFPAAVNGVKQNGENIVFPAAVDQWGTIRYWALTDAVTDGNLLTSGKTIQRFVGVGRTVVFLPLTLTIRIR